LLELKADCLLRRMTTVLRWPIKPPQNFTRSAVEPDCECDLTGCSDVPWERLAKLRFRLQQNTPCMPWFLPPMHRALRVLSSITRCCRWCPVVLTRRRRVLPSKNYGSLRAPDDSGGEASWASLPPRYYRLALILSASPARRRWLITVRHIGRRSRCLSAVSQKLTDGVRRRPALHAFSSSTPGLSVVLALYPARRRPALSQLPINRHSQRPTGKQECCLCRKTTPHTLALRFNLRPWRDA